MSGVFGDVYAQAVLDREFGAIGSVTASHQIGLSTTLPASDGTNITEPGGGIGYARVSVDNTSTNWSTATGRTKTNATAVNFPAATGSWGDPAYFVIWDSTGTYVAYGTLDGHGPIAAGITPSFAPGTLSISLPSS